MSELVGVQSPLDITVSFGMKQEILKREALMFDRIAIPDYQVSMSAIRKRRSNKLPDYLNEVEWLFDTGIIFEPNFDFPDEQLMMNQEYKDYYEEEYYHWNTITESIRGLKKSSKKYKATYFAHGVLASQAHIRLASIQLREVSKIDAYPVFSLPFKPSKASTNNKFEIVQIVLNTLPIPDESTSWEQIIEYRSDPDSHNKFLDLREWMSDLARATLPPLEIEQKLEFLMSQYQRHMKLHKLKINTGMLETVVVTGAELLEDLVKFRWGKIAKGLFSIRKRQIALMEGELTSPGSEVAYIIKTLDNFG